MTVAKFSVKDGAVCGFSLVGHSTEDAEDDIGRALCSAVSSAAYMAANTVTEVIGECADTFVADGEMRFMINSPSKETQIVLKGFMLHLTELSKQYEKRLSVITEV